MYVQGFIGLSLIDWDEMPASVIFLGSCNLNCPWCYNKDLVLRFTHLHSIDFKEVREYLIRHKVIEGVVISGGEPTVNPNLADICLQLKALKRKIKLDTNGTCPDVIRALMNAGYLDYIAMDIKAPFTPVLLLATGGFGQYYHIDIKESIQLIKSLGIDYEFRTTVVPTIHGAREIEEMAKLIAPAKKYVLQRFRNDRNTIDPSFGRITPYSIEEMKAFQSIAKKYIDNVILR